MPSEIKALQKVPLATAHKDAIANLSRLAREVRYQINSLRNMPASAKLDGQIRKTIIELIALGTRVNEVILSYREPRSRSAAEEEALLAAEPPRLVVPSFPPRAPIPGLPAPNGNPISNHESDTLGTRPDASQPARQCPDQPAGGAPNPGDLRE